MRAMRVVVGAFGIAINSAVAHRVDMAFQVGLAVLNVGVSLGGLLVIFSNATSLAGWSSAQMIVLIGTFEAASGILATGIEPNFSWFKERVLSGEFDDYLLKPMGSLGYVSILRLAPFGLLQVVFGLALVVTGVTIDSLWSILGSFTWILSFFVGLGIVWSLRVILATLAFWVPHFEPSFLFLGVWQLGRFPTKIYGRLLGAGLNFVVPIAFIGAVPARYMSGSYRGFLLLYGFLFSVGMVRVATWFWKKSLGRYLSATS